MKIPFASVLGPLLKRNHKSIARFCSLPILSFSRVYVGALGILGVLLSLFDIVRVIRCGSVLPGFLWRERLKDGPVISPEAERDFKLVCLVLSTEYYGFLVLGLLTNNPIFFLPFLSLYALILAIEFIIFVIKLLTCKQDIGKSSLAMTLFMLYNWSAVLCTFTRLTTGCDI